jgi:hypothetical protein
VMTIVTIIFLSMLIGEWCKGRKVWDLLVMFLLCLAFEIWAMIKMLKQTINDFTGSKRP